MRHRVHRALMGLSALLFGCRAEPGPEGAACKSKTDCADGLSCVDNVCAQLAAGPAASTQASGDCETIAALAGEWTFDTTVIGAEDLTPRGINGHYTMTVAVDGCAATVTLVKTGHDDVTYSDSAIQTSEAPLSESEAIPGAVTATFSLKAKPTHTMTFVVRDGQLFGHWQAAGAEWTRAGMSGFLRGVRRGQDLAKVEDFAAQPCEVQCLTQCDAPRRRADASLDEPALAACMTACAADQPIVGCGPGEPLPDELVVAVHGPAKSFEAVCSKVGAELAARGDEEPDATPRCSRELEVDGKPAARKLSNGALAGSFGGAELVQVGLGEFTEELILVLETEAGWFWTAGLVDLGSTRAELTGGVLRARELLSAPGREVIAELARRETDADAFDVTIDTADVTVVCAAGSPPRCVKVPIGWSSETVSHDPDAKAGGKKTSERRAGELYLAVLPLDRISISTPADAPAQDLALRGIYRWE